MTELFRKRICSAEIEECVLDCHRSLLSDRRQEPKTCPGASRLGGSQHSLLRLLNEVADLLAAARLRHEHDNGLRH